MLNSLELEGCNISSTVGHNSWGSQLANGQLGVSLFFIIRFYCKNNTYWLFELEKNSKKVQKPEDI